MHNTPIENRLEYTARALANIPSGRVYGGRVSIELSVVGCVLCVVSYWLNNIANLKSKIFNRKSFFA